MTMNNEYGQVFCHVLDPQNTEASKAEMEEKIRASLRLAEEGVVSNSSGGLALWVLLRATFSIRTFQNKGRLDGVVR